ncbi:TadE/TadG family type IV pilus assembly protein [Oricola sp.]|uniref:pilus assembly protein TadG-related protein n=1 Tax=Oricola sp. TaxID=1979950 RepID=UPI0025F2DCA5|nr:TadE/TadG family type IV pilus assembly protein [Oricola sp.]MCI5078517.1 pilus assembly protein [Oricola sp.]
MSNRKTTSITQKFTGAFATVAARMGAWRDNRRGAMAVNFALLLIPLLASVGLSIDGSRFLLTRYHLQAAVDAAALALGTVYEDQATLDSLGDTFVAKNFSLADASLDSVSTVVSGDTVKVSGTATMQTLFMSILQVSEVKVSVSTTVKRAGGGLLVSLVLDNTGSMWSGSPSKISALRSASDILVDALFDDDPEPKDLRMSIVPYAATVNPGSVADSLVGPHSYGLRSDHKDRWKGCVMERDGADSIADTGPDVAKWRPFFWEPSVDNDYDLDNPSTIAPGGAYDSNAITGPNIGCPTPILPLTKSYAAVDAAVDALTAWNRGGTLGDIGMAWGIRTLSPGLPFDESTEIDPKTGATLWDSPRWRKAIMMMTDGDNVFYDLPGNAGPNSAHPGKSDYTGYGRLGESQANAIFNTSNTNTAKGIVDNRLKSLCTNAKNQDIIIYTVTFGSSPSSSTKQIFQDCASDPGKYYHAPSKTELENIFGVIGAELSKLRIIK